MQLETEDAVAGRLEALRALFPESFVAGTIDPRRLLAALGSVVDDGPERYGLSWTGRAEACRAIQVPSTATLVPVPEQSIDFATADNLFIEGDNLEVLKLLQKSYHGQVKLIYIDPPYNTGNDLLYPDDYREGLRNYLRYSGQVDGRGIKLSTSTETAGRFHSRWLSMMLPRLCLARNLLRQDGVLFVSVDDTELANLACLLADVFGEENRVGIICWRNVTDNNPTLINQDHEFILCYARDRSALPQTWRSLQSDAKTLLQEEYRRLAATTRDREALERGVRQFIADHVELMGTLSRYRQVDERGIFTGSESVHNPRAGGYDFEVLHPTTGRPMRKPANGYRFPEATFRAMQRAGKILYGPDENRIVKIKKYLSEHEATLRSVITLDGRLGAYDLKRVFESKEHVFPNPKPVDLLLLLLSFVTEKDDLILDFFAGSGTTGEATLRLNARDGGSRRFILVQLPEPIEPGAVARRLGHQTIADLCLQRVRRVMEQLSAAASSPGQPFETAPVPAPPTGLKAFKLARSNFQTVDEDSTPSDPARLAEQIRRSAASLVPGWSPQSVLHELLLEAGLPLTAPIETLAVREATVFSVAHGRLLVCLEETLSQEALRGMIALQPQRVLCLDQAYRGKDADRINAAVQMKIHGIDFRTV